MNPLLYILFLVDKSMMMNNGYMYSNNNNEYMFWKLIVFQVSLNLDPMKEILKIGCQIYILMKKGIILRLHYSSTISVWAWTEKKCDNESHKKETKHIHVSAADLLHTVFANADIAKMKREK